MAERQWYVDYQEQLKAEQGDKSREEIADTLKQTNEHVFDPVTAKPDKHRWIDRGMKYSCEGASHPMHQSWKRQGATPIAQ